ncbi:MAG: hypothetical protein ACI4GD_07880 [Lachnospiraceae bacterium]
MLYVLAGTCVVAIVINIIGAVIYTKALKNEDADLSYRGKKWLLMGKVTGIIFFVVQIIFFVSKLSL